MNDSYLECDRLSGQRLDEYLHSTAKTENEMQRALLLNVVVRERSAVLKLLSREDETLLIGRDAFFILNLLLHVFNRVRRLNLIRSLIQY